MAYTARGELSQNRLLFSTARTSCFSSALNARWGVGRGFGSTFGFRAR
jgi:hypothetical protein